MNVTELEQAVKKELERSGSSRLALACSGGLDSVLLGEILCRLGVPFMVLHVNHGWRAEESEADAAWVRDWCRVHQRRVVVKKLSPRLPRTEGAARLARMEFFEQ
ncbi:MAG: tRNA(Ile)-lysidine synthetase, partial [Blastochloris sp.]|nr:tRNA(Ile)-lysidine synthetase [Blastochloris sp.]